MLEFWRYGAEGDSHNSRSYRRHPKVRQAAKTAKSQLRARVLELGFSPDVYTFEVLRNWLNDADEVDYETLKAIRYDPIVCSCFSKIKKHSFSKSYHSPPVSRGLYAFPPEKTDWFLVAWKSDQKLSKHVIKYKKPTLWCHLKEAAQSLNLQILDEKGSWILINSRDYNRCLKKAVSLLVEEERAWLSDPSEFYLTPKQHCAGNGDLFEVFLL